MRTPKQLRYYPLVRTTRGNRCSHCEWEGSVHLGGKVNVYHCFNGHETWTIHADDGVTPFIIGCQSCGEDAHSSFYQCDQTPPVIHGVWSKEPNDWWGSNAAQQDHLEKGGVFLYAVPPNKQLCLHDDLRCESKTVTEPRDYGYPSWPNPPTENPVAREAGPRRKEKE